MNLIFSRGLTSFFLSLGIAAISNAQPVDLIDRDIPALQTKKLCTWNKKTYSVGAIVKDAEFSFQCIQVFKSESRSSAFVAWLPLRRAK